VKLGGDPLDRLLGAVEQTAADDVRATTFVRGLALGALVGAAIAGSTIWQRRHGRAVRRPVGVASNASVGCATDEPPSQPG
jgi:hypothetical protein